MKRLLSIIILSFLLVNNTFAEVKLKKSINAHLKEGYKIISIANSGGQIIYYLQKKNNLIVCYMYELTDKPWKCVSP